MLGKRCRTLQRTTSISHNMGPHPHHHQHPDAGNPHVPAAIPQIIGFNPLIENTHNHTGGEASVVQHKLVGALAVGMPDFEGTALVSPPPHMLARQPQPHDMYDDDPKHHNRGAGTSGSPSTKKPQINPPRSALQTLLAAARQITYNSDQSASSIGIYSSESVRSSSFKTNQSSPSCANSSSTSLSAAKQGSFTWQGVTLGAEATSKENKQFLSTPKASMPITTTHQAKGPAPHEFSQSGTMNEALLGSYPLVRNMISEVDSENVFDVEGTSTNFGSESSHQLCLEPTKDQHSLYLATSPLTADFVPNLASSMSFLESCYLCKRPLGQGRDIFMYRGENAFCSMDCRDKQMRLEERKDKLRYIHSQMSKLNVQTQVSPYINNVAGTGNTFTNTTSCYQPHSKLHRQQYSGGHSQRAVAYNNKQPRTSLLMPAA